MYIQFSKKMKKRHRFYVNLRKKKNQEKNRPGEPEISVHNRQRFRQQKFCLEALIAVWQRHYRALFRAQRRTVRVRGGTGFARPHAQTSSRTRTQPSKPIRGLSGTLMALEESPDSTHRNKAHQLNQPSICVLCILTQYYTYTGIDLAKATKQPCEATALHSRTTAQPLHWAVPLLCHRCRTAAAAHGSVRQNGVRYGLFCC